MKCGEGAALNGKNPARIKMLIWGALMNCDGEAALNGKKPSENQNFEGRENGHSLMSCGEGAALNGKTPARIKVLTWAALKNCERGAALNGTKPSENQNLRGASGGQQTDGGARLGRGYY